MQLTTRNATLADLAKLLQEQNAAKLDAVVPAARIHSVNGTWRVDDLGEPTITEDGVTPGSGLFLPTEIADGHAAEKLGIPRAYLRKLRDQRPDLYDANVNGWLHGAGPTMTEDEDGTVHYAQDAPDPRTFLLRTFRASPDVPGVARALLSDRFGIMDNFDSLVAMLQGVRDAGVDAQVYSCNLTESRMRVRVACPDVAVLAPALMEGYRSPWGRGGGTAPWDTEAGRAHGWLRPSDQPVIFAGFEFSNSETGGGAWTFCPVFTVQACTNGLRITADQLRSVHLGGKLDEGIVRWSAETEMRQLALLTAKAADAVRTFCSPAYAEQTIARLTALATKELAEPAKAVELVTKRTKVSEAEAATILDHFVRGGVTTAGGVLHAFTSAAQTVDDPDRAAELEELGIEALNLAAEMAVA